MSQKEQQVKPSVNTESFSIHGNKSRFMLAAIVLFTLITIAVIIAFYYHEKNKTLRNFESMIGIVCQAKTAQISEWRNYQYHVAQYFLDSALAKMVFKWQTDRQPDLADYISMRLRALQDTFHFSHINIVTPEGHVLFSNIANAKDTDSEEKRLILESFSLQKPVLSDLHVSSDSTIHITVVVPIFSEKDNKPAGAFIFDIDPYYSLFPLVQSWPTDSASAETLLVRQEGDNVLFLNELRFKKDTALKLRISKDKTNIPSVKAVFENKRGVVEGVDYRGVPVISSVSSVPGTNWIMVSKVDLSEALEPLEHFNILIFILIGSVLITSLSIFFLIRQNIFRRYYQNILAMKTDLDESETRYKDLFENNADAIFIADLASRKLLACNSKAFELSGYSMDELLNMRTDQLHPPENRDKIMQYFKEFTEGKSSGFIYTDILTKAGKVIPVQILHSNLDFDGKKAVTGIVRNITEQKAATKKIKDSEDRFRKIAESANDMIWECDINGLYTYISPTSEKILGYKPEEIIGKKYFYDFFDPDTREEFKNAALAVFRNKGIFKYLINANIHKNGNKVLLETSGVPLFDENGNCTGYCGTDTDVTLRKQAEMEREQFSAKLERIFDETVNALSLTVEMKDPYTKGHSHKVAKLARAIAESMALKPEQVQGLYIAALLHDIGKIAIPAEILSKPHPLTNAEYDIIKTHSRTGYDTLKTIEFPWPVARIVLEHHERIDGSGYPDGKKGKDILIESRILAVADAVEAMSFDRPYRGALGFEKAMEEIISKQGILFDTEVVSACQKIFKEIKFEFLS